MDMKEVSELVRELLKLEENERELYSNYSKAKQESGEKEDEINKHLDEGARINVREFIVSYNNEWHLIKVSREKGKVGCSFIINEIDSYSDYEIDSLSEGSSKGDA